MRKVFIVFGVLLVLLIGFTVRASFSNQDLMPFTGRWKGGFTVDSIQKGSDTADDRHRSRLEGYVQVYLTGRKYVLHLEGEQQGIDVTGTWTAKGDRITLQSKSVTIDDQGGADARNPNKKYIPNEVVNEAYSRQMVLVLSKDKHNLRGLKVSVGDLIGEHAFEKDSP